MPKTRTRRSQKRTHTPHTRKNKQHQKRQTRSIHKPVNSPRQYPQITASPCETVLRNTYPALRVHVELSPDVQKALLHKFSQRIPYSKCGDRSGENGVTYFELFRALSGFDYKTKKPHIVLIKGGFVRDIVQGKALDKIHDIDVVHTRPFNSALYGNNGIHTLNIRYTAVKDKAANFFFMKIGADSATNTNQSVDCTHTALEDFSHYEAPVNTLMINVSYTDTAKNELDRVYDITGKGWEHAQQRVWDAPPGVLDGLANADADRNARAVFWLSSVKLWRMLKFQQRGYAVPLATKRIIYTYWLKHYHEVPTYNWRNPWAKHFSGSDTRLGQAIRNTRDAIDNMLKTVCADFIELKMDTDAGKFFCVMLMEYNMLTVHSRLKDLRRLKSHDKLVRFTKGAVHSLASSIEQISKNNKDIQQLCDVIVSSRELTTHQAVFDYVRRLVCTDLLTAFPIITFHTIPTQDIDYKLLYKFPQFRQIHNQQAHTSLCYPLTKIAKKLLQKGLSTLLVRSNTSNATKTKTESKSTEKTLFHALHSTHEALLAVSKEVQCFVVSAGVKRFVCEAVVDITVLQFVWYVPSIALSNVPQHLSVQGDWKASTHALVISPSIEWTFTDSLESLSKNHMVVLDVLNHYLVDWSGDGMVRWVSGKRGL